MRILRAVTFSLCVILFTGFFQSVSAATIVPMFGSTTDPIADGAIDKVIDGILNYDENLALGTSLTYGTFGGPYTVRFNLGNSYDLTDFRLWNNAGWAEGDGEGVNSFVLNFYNSSLGSVDSFSSTAQDILAVQSFNLTASNVQVVDFVIHSNHFLSSGLPDREYVYFYEINFEGTAASPVPLPSAIWLLGSGLFGLVGIQRKFRNV